MAQHRVASAAVRLADRPPFHARSPRNSLTRLLAVLCYCPDYSCIPLTLFLKVTVTLRYCPDYSCIPSTLFLKVTVTRVRIGQHVSIVL